MSPNVSTAALVALHLRGLGLDGGAHHETLKKAWRASGLTYVPAVLPQVRIEMAKLRTVPPPPPGGVNPDRIVVVGGVQVAGPPPTAPPPEETTEADWGEGPKHPLQEAWERGAIDAAVARENATREVEQRKNQSKAEKLAELKAMREEQRLARENARAAEAADLTNEGDEAMGTATKKKRNKAKAPKTARKPAAAPASKEEVLRDLQKRYPHVQKVTEWNESGKAGRIQIACTIKGPECQKTRDIKVQDAFQVKACEACRGAAKKIAKAKKS